jgi:hypothetical protein
MTCLNSVWLMFDEFENICGTLISWFGSITTLPCLDTCVNVRSRSSTNSRISFCPVLSDSAANTNEETGFAAFLFYSDFFESVETVSTLFSFAETVSS